MNNGMKIFNCCCVPLVNENKRIKKLKPFLMSSLAILMLVIFLDFFLFETDIYIYTSFSIFPLFILIVKRYYYFYTINCIYFLFVVFPKIINDIGTYFQSEILSSANKVILCLKIFCFLLLILANYFFFIYYKELKFQFIIEKPIEKYMIDDTKDKSEKEKLNMAEEIQLANIITISE